MMFFSPVKFAILWFFAIEGPPKTSSSVVQWRRDKRDVDMMVECDTHCIPYDQITDYDVLLEYEDEEDDKNLFLSDYKKKQCAFPCKIVHVNKTMETHYSPDDDFTIVSVEELPEDFKVFNSNVKSNYDLSRTAVTDRKNIMFSSAVYDNLTKEIALKNDTSGISMNKEAPSNVTSNETSVCECVNNGPKQLNNTTTSFLKSQNESFSESIPPSQNTSSLLLSKLNAKNLQVNYSDYSTITDRVVMSEIGKMTTEKQTFSIIPMIPKIIRLSVFEAEIGEVGATTSNYLTKTHKSVKPTTSAITNGLRKELTKITTEDKNDQTEGLDLVNEHQFTENNWYSNQNRTDSVAQNMKQNIKEETNPNNAPSQRPKPFDFNFSSIFSTSSTPFHISESGSRDSTEMNKLSIYDKPLTTHESIFTQTNLKNEGTLPTLQQDTILKDLLKHSTTTEAQTTTAFSSRNAFEGEGEHNEKYSGSSIRYSTDLSHSTSRVTVEPSDSSTMETTMSVNTIKNSSNNTILNQSERSSTSSTDNSMTKTEVASPNENNSYNNTDFKEDFSGKTRLNNADFKEDFSGKTRLNNASNLEKLSSVSGNQENHYIDHSSVPPTIKNLSDNKSRLEKGLSEINIEHNDSKENPSLLQTNNTVLKYILNKTFGEQSTKYKAGSDNPTNPYGSVKNNTEMEVTDLTSNISVNSSNGLKFNNDNIGYDIKQHRSLNPVSNTTDNPSISRKSFEIGNTSIRFSNLTKASKDGSNDDYELDLESADQLYNHSYRLVDSNIFHEPYLLPQHLQETTETLGSLSLTDLPSNNVSHNQNINDHNNRRSNQTTPLRKI